MLDIFNFLFIFHVLFHFVFSLVFISKLFSVCFFSFYSIIVSSCSDIFNYLVYWFRAAKVNLLTGIILNYLTA